MCGIAGALDGRARLRQEPLEDLARQMAGELRHRGPDAHGVWCDAAAGLALGHTRLAIVDLTPAGAQPMTSADGRWRLVFNGEVYNHVELRRRLRDAGCAFRGGSDTEVLLEAVAAWGPDKALGQVNGMFALALWDAADRSLLLARDRMGEKPLYYGWFDGVLLFASEPKALFRHPCFRAAVDPRALALYLRHGYVPAPHAMFAGLRKLPAGHLLHVSGSATNAPVPYWTLEEAVRAGAREPLRVTMPEAADQVEALLSDSVGLRMRADVPVGAFLSGGIDSSLVVALMREHTSRAVRTFTIGFTEPEWDEAPHAAAVAAHLGTRHEQLYVTPAQAQDVVSRLPWIYDEPFADSSQIPTVLLAAMTRAHVVVSLSGDGGDELFAGYERHVRLAQLSRLRRRIPGPARSLAGRVVAARDAAWWGRALAPLGPRLWPSTPPDRLGERVVRAGAVLTGADDDVYGGLLALWPAPERLLRTGATPAAHAAPAVTAVAAPRHPGRGGTAAPRLADQAGYLPDDLLVKVDRATMAVGLEARVPFLDHRVVELSWRLPEEVLVAGGWGKAVLREVLGRHVPPALFQRPKAGFGVPIAAWLRGDLREWAEELLAPAGLEGDGLWDPAPIRAAWAEHLAGADHAARLWAILMFQAWAARWLRGAP